MPAPSDLLRLGYWPYRHLLGDIPSPIRRADEYENADVLNIACTQTGLPASQQRRIVDDWTRRLPSVPARTVVFSSKVSQDLFDAACAAPHLEALSIKWSSCISLGELKRTRNLQALFLGSSPEISDLRPLSGLTNLQHLFMENVRAPVDLSSIRPLCNLREFGLSAARGHRMKVLTLEPLSALQSLEVIWLVSLTFQDDGLYPLHKLQSLKSLRTTIRSTSPELKDLCAAVPSLEFFGSSGFRVGHLGSEWVGLTRARTAKPPHYQAQASRVA